MPTVSLTSTCLSHAEATGITSGSLGMMSVRRHQVPRDWPSPVLRFMAANLRPLPSARRPAPSRPSRPPLAAA